jgi:hypothetical protein
MRMSEGIVSRAHLWVVAGLSLIVAGCSSSPTAPAALTLGAQLENVQAATAKYQNVAAALADGFLAPPTCASLAGQGAGGYHYTNPGRVDGRVVAEEPETLLYIPENGGLRLVGVEYFVPVVQDSVSYFGVTAPSNPGATPKVLGRDLDGPMAGHNPTMPWHWDLHVWIWRSNPAGTFSPWNPDLSCS